MTIPDNFRLSTAKCWQMRSVGLVWQISCHPTPESGFKKGFLIAQIKGSKVHLEIRTEKPQDLLPAGGVAAIFRKHIPSGQITGIYHNPAEFSYAIPWERGPLGTYWLHLNGHKQSYLELISPDDLSQVRYSEQGIYTHKKPTQPPDPFTTKGWENILPKLLPTPPVADIHLSSKESPEEDGCLQSEDSGCLKSEESPDTQETSLFQRDARRKVARRLKTVRQAWAKSTQNLPKSEELELLARQAGLLRDFAYRISSDTHLLRLDPAETGLPETVEIPIDPDRSVGQQIEDIYTTIKKQKRGLALGQARVIKEERDLRQLEKASEELHAKSLGDSEVIAILKRVNLDEATAPKQNPNPGSQQTSGPYRIFHSSDGCEIWVGKSPSENDQLAKLAKSNDYWLHIVGSTGSHVIIPYKSLGKDRLIKESTKREAGMLAIHFSKLRGDLAGEVYFTQKQFIKKKKGMPAGLWLVEKSTNFFLKYQEDELKRTLDRKPG